MRSFTFRELTEGELDAFSARHPQGNFQQTSLMGRVRSANGAEVTRLGVVEDGQVVAAVQLEVYRSRLSTFAEVHDGPLCDFHDVALTKYLFENLAAFARKAGCAQLDITPEMPYQERDSEGEPLPGAEPDRAAFESITSCGFTHAGFTREYNAVPRWRYVKDLTGISDEAALLASYAKKTKRNVGISRDSFVTVERIGRDQLATYHAICQLSCDKREFDNRPLEYFEQIYDTLGDTAEFNVAYVDLGAYHADWQARLAKLDADIARLDTPGDAPRSAKTERRLADLREKQGAAKRRVDATAALIAECGERVPAAAALFVWHPRECVYLYSGNDGRFAEFCATAAIQHHVMLECLERGVTRYNFYGIDGDFGDHEGGARGLLQFKQGFCGYVEELMGSFTLPVRPVVFAAKQLAHKILGR